MSGTRVSALPTATAPGTFYVIEGGASKKIVLGTMATQNAGAVAITGGAVNGTAIGTSTRAVGAFSGVGIGLGVQLQPLHVYGVAGAPSASTAVGLAEFNTTTTQTLAIGGASAAPYCMWLQTRQLNPGYTGGTFPLALNPVGGNVGVGNSNPLDPLDVTGAVRASTHYKVGVQQVVSARKTGWAAASGTATRTTFATSTVTTAQLAERVKALLDDLISHGLIGA